MAAADDAMRRIATVLQELSDRLEKEMADLIAALDTTDGKLKTSEHNVENIVGIRRQVAAIAEREGLPEIVAALRAELPAVVQEVLEASDLPLGEFRVDIERELLAVLEGQEQDIAKAIVKGVSDDMASAMRHAITGAVDMRELQKDVASSLNTSLGRAAVSLDRAVREMGDRALIEAGKQASELLDDDSFVYIYEGPKDDGNRPYCAARVGKWMTPTEADKLDPRERFNCRHVPIPALLSEVKEAGTLQFEG